MHRGWLSKLYRTNLAKSPETYERLKFKLTASEIFKGINTVFYLCYINTHNIVKNIKCIIYFVGKKLIYPESLKFDFNIDRAGILQKLINTNQQNSENPKFVYLVSF